MGLIFIKKDNLRPAQQELFTDFESMEARAEGQILKTYAKSLIEFKKYMAQLFEKYDDDGKLTYDEMIKYSRLDKMDANIAGLTVSLYSENAKEIASTLEIAYRNSFDGISEAVSRAWGNKTLIPIIKDEEMQRALTNDISGLKWTSRMGVNREYAVNKIRETIVRGLYNGETYSQMAKRLDDALGKDVVSSIRIVRTESYRVFSQARKDRLDRVKGLGMTKEWLTSGDEKVRDNHTTMNGDKVAYNDMFLLPNGNSGFAPGLIGAPEDDINCRCTWIMDIVD